MIRDHFSISSNFRPKKSAAQCTVKEFFEEFEKFYEKVMMRKNPDLPHKICDPYGFALLCQDYKEKSAFYSDDEDLLCSEAFINKYKTEFDSLFKFKFPFKILLDLLHRAYYFNYELALNIYQMQRNPLRIFEEIMNGHGYVMNKLTPNKKAVGKLMNYAYDSKITLDENNPIPIPHKNRVCDGKTWPCIISKSYAGAMIRKDDIDGYGEGLFIISNNDEIIDCLKINDLWLVDTSLENRLKFGFHSRNYEVAPYMKAFSWRSAFDAGKLLNCNKKEGILVRPCYEDYFKTTWFEWSENSLIYCCLINGKLQISGRKKSKPDYYTLDGYLGEVPLPEQRVHERIWLDDFDIKEFQMVLGLED